MSQDSIMIRIRIVVKSSFTVDVQSIVLHLYDKIFVRKCVNYDTTI